MALKPIAPNLRGLRYNSIQPAKIQIAIPPGDTLFVSDEVAEQLTALSTHFEDVSATGATEEATEVDSSERQPPADPGRYSERGSAPKTRKPKG